MAVSSCRQLQPLKENSRTNELYLQLPVPHDSIIITPPRMSDARAMTAILNDARVYKTLLSPPFPYLPGHAESWLASTRQGCDAVLDTLKEAATKDEQSHPGETGGMELALVHVDRCPVRALREVQADGTDVFLGDIDILRCGRFDYLRDKEQEAVLSARNAAQPAGNPEIIWDIGYYLAASHHGRGIMSAALQTIIHEWAVPRMNAHIIHGRAFTGNAGSVRVFLKNGFKIFDLVEDCVTIPESKGGGMVGLHFMEWRLTAQIN